MEKDKKTEPMKEKEYIDKLMLELKKGEQSAADKEDWISNENIMKEFHINPSYI